VNNPELIWRSNTPIADFLRKWHRVTAFLGATIVLATFLVKDEKRDSIKDEIEKVENARATYLIREGEGDSLVRMANIQTALEGSAAPPKITDKELRDAIEGFNRQLAWAWERVLPKETDADNLVRFANSVPDVPKDLKEQTAGLSESVKTLAKRIDADIVWRTNEHTAKDFSAESEEISKMNVTLEGKYDDSKIRLKELADSAITTREDQLRLWTHGSNILFVLGWIVGLTGKTFGFES